MRWKIAAVAPGPDQPAATAAKIKTASHTKFLTVPRNFVKGPDTMDPKTTIRRVILSSTDLTAKIQACKTMDCSDDDLTDGIEIDITGGPRLLYWLAVNGGLVQYLGHREADGARDHRRHREPARRQNHV